MAKKKGNSMALNLSKRQWWLAISIAAILLLIAIPLSISYFSGNDAPTGTSATASPTTATNISVEWKQNAEGAFSDQEKAEIAQKLKVELARTITEDVDKYVILSGSQEGDWGDVNVSVYPSSLNGESVSEPLFVLMRKSGGTWSLWTQSNEQFCDEIKQTPEGYFPGKESYFGHCYR